MKPSLNAFQTSVALSDSKCPKIQRLLRSGVFLFHFNEESNESLNATCTVFHTCINLFHFFFFLFFNSTVCKMTGELQIMKIFGFLLQSKARYLIILKTNCSYSETLMVCFPVYFK